MDYDKGCGLACLEILTVWCFSYLYAVGREVPREKWVLFETKCVVYKKWRIRVIHMCTSIYPLFRKSHGAIDNSIITNPAERIM